MSSVGYKDIEKFRVDPKDFKIDESKKTQKGGFSEVTFQIQKKTKNKCAVKKLKDKIDDNDTQKSFFREVQILSSHEHPAIVPFIGFYIDKENYGYIYLEEAEHGSLSSILKSINDKTIPKNTLTSTKKFIISYGVAIAMKYLHDKNVIHRDLKVENILIDENYYPLITDFGTSKEISEDNVSLTSSRFAFTPKIQAPELFDDPDENRKNPAIDVYSYGITMYELWIDFPVYKDIKSPFKIYKGLQDGNRPPIPDSTQENLKYLISKCWSQEPEERPTFDEIIHELETPNFLKDIDKKAVEEYKKFIRKNEKPIPTYEKSPKLNFLRQNALKKNAKIDDIFTYVVVQSNGRFGEPDHKEIYEFSKSYLKNIYDKKLMDSKEWIKKTSIIELCTGKSLAYFKKFGLSENFFRRSVYHGEPMAAFYLAELMFYKNIKQKFPGEMIHLYEYAANHNIPDAKKKLEELNH